MIKPSWEGGQRRGPLCLSLSGLEGSPAARLTSGMALQLPGFRELRERPREGHGGHKQRRRGRSVCPAGQRVRPPAAQSCLLDQPEQLDSECPEARESPEALPVLEHHFASASP
ncbi:unnamed protein product [Rangifer tarandus platyrhynchus]|uniref:Uncharacterized protein n=1 Tax=Rangifer tarandus platyrhynchus TaxID=3082113 RepID=A0AC60A569_RANTA